MDPATRRLLFTGIEVALTLGLMAAMSLLVRRFPKPHPIGTTVLYGVALGSVSLLASSILALFADGWFRLGGIAAAPYLGVMIAWLLRDMLASDDATLEAWAKDPARKSAFDRRVLAILLPGLLVVLAAVWPVAAHLFGYHQDGR